jgi:nucleoside-diphosphate-sugar epimerase
VRAFVTGGGGFLGSAIVRALRARGDEVVSYSRAAYPEIEALGVHCVRGDLTDLTSLQRTMSGADTVFHVAAKAGVWGPRAEYDRTNVDGTRHVIAACRANRVKRLVFTSSPSVCFDGRDHVRAGNDLPYATRFLAHYPRSKAEAEALVLAANGADGLVTCALRPHLIFGPGDPHLLPRLLERARAGRLAIVGAGDNEVSLTYIATAADAHVAAADRLHESAPHAGRAYFVSQSEPVRLWDWISSLCTELEIAPPSRRIPFSAAWTLGGTMEATWRTFRLPGEPAMTRFVAQQLARSHSYDMRPAERDFGWRESVTMAQATELTLAALRDRVPA